MTNLDMQSIENLKNLSNLLNPDHGDSSDDGDVPDSSQSAFTPASIGSNKNSKKKELKTPYEKTKSNSDDIWGEDEIQEYSVFADKSDNRPSPEYDIAYKQKVTTEDMFLGMSGKNPSTACCESMVVKIKLPGCQMKDVELDVKQTFLDCRSPTYRLLLSLPHPVDPKSGNAKWDGDAEVLEVTLTMTREYDFINFQ